MPGSSSFTAGAVARACRLLAERGFVAATEGNVSVRLPSGAILVSGTRVEKRLARASDVVRLGADGRKLAGRREPSSEAALHRTIYAARSGVRAVVHAHPPFSTAFAVARKPIPVDAIPEVAVEFGRIPIVPFAVPSTGRLSRAITPFLKRGDFFLLANHGVVALGRDLDDALSKVERAEHAAEIILLARLLGGERRLGGRDLAALASIRKRRRITTD